MLFDIAILPFGMPIALDFINHMSSSEKANPGAKKVIVPKLSVRQYDPNPKDWEALPIPSERGLPKPHNVFHRRERRAAPQRDGRPHMSKDSKSFVSTAGMATVFGIDSHSRTTTICALSRESGETETRTFRGNDYAAMARWMSGFPAPALGVYEAGCTGFVPARRLSAGSVSVVPIAPSKMPASSDSRTRKNDRNDAARLARLAVAGELKEVWVPPCEIEGMRELAHALDDLKAQRTRAFQHVLALLCRHGVIWDERTPRGALRKPWCDAFWTWLRGIDLGDAAAQAALRSAIRAAESADEQYGALLDEAHRLAGASPLAGIVRALQCLKCVQFVTALTFAAEVGDFSRFRSGRSITSYFGLAPSESSSGTKKRMGAISRCGCALTRSLLVECSWSALRCSPAKGKACPETVDVRIRERARTLSARLCSHRRSLVARGVPACKANAATAAELARFMLFLGSEQQSLAAEAS